MKNLIRKLSIRKYSKETYEGIPKHYLVVYKNKYKLLNNFELKELLLKPKKDQEIEYIFNWEDRLIINTEFEEIEEKNERNSNNT